MVRSDNHRNTKTKKGRLACSLCNLHVKYRLKYIRRSFLKKMNTLVSEIDEDQTGYIKGHQAHGNITVPKRKPEH